MIAGDLEWVLALDGETEFAPHWTEEIYRGYLPVEETGVLRRFALVAEVDGRPVGMALGRLLLDGVENLCELEWIAVERTRRRQGVGRLLMDGVEAWCREHGGLGLGLEVRAGNVTAQMLYRRVGWRETGRRKEYYREPVEDAVVMERPLAGAPGGGGKADGEIG
ncbi:MAG: GNAT family N-acetyltransferase [Acidobacteriaceae bacterium]